MKRKKTKYLLASLMLLSVLSGCSKQKNKDNKDKDNTEAEEVSQKEEIAPAKEDTNTEDKETVTETVYFPGTYYRYAYSSKNGYRSSDLKFVFDEDGTGVRVIFNATYEEDENGRTIVEGDAISIIPFTYTYENGTVRIVMGGSSTDKYEYVANGESFSSEDNTVVLSQSKNNALISIEREPGVHMIVYNLDGGENHPDNPVSYVENTYIYLDEATKEGSEFLGWTGSNGAFPQLTVYMLANGDTLTFTANWSDSTDATDENSFFSNLTYETAKSLNDLNAMLDFDFKIPSRIANSTKVELRRYSNGMAEAVYFYGTNTVATIRQAVSAIDLSQSSDSYKVNTNVSYEDLYGYPYQKVIHVKGDAENDYLVADWGYSDYKFSLTVSEGISKDELIRIADIVNGSNGEAETASSKNNRIYLSTRYGGFMWMEGGQVSITIDQNNYIWVIPNYQDYFVYIGKIEKDEDGLYRIYGNEYGESDTVSDRPDVLDETTDGYLRLNEDGSFTVLNDEKAPYYEKEQYNICRYIRAE